MPALRRRCRRVWHGGPLERPQSVVKFLSFRTAGENRRLVRCFVSKLLGSEFRASDGRGRSDDVKVVQDVDGLHGIVLSRILSAGKRTWVVWC